MNREKLSGQYQRVAQVHPSKSIERGDPVMKHNDKEQSYIESDEEREHGHEDTRHKNFECENKTSLGCDPGIDVAG